MNSLRVPPPRFPWKKYNFSVGTRKVDRRHCKAVSCCRPWRLAANFAGLAWRWDSRARKGPADVRRGARPGGQHALVRCQAEPGPARRDALQSRPLATRKPVPTRRPYSRGRQIPVALLRPEQKQVTDKPTSVSPVNPPLSVRCLDAGSHWA